jgi:Calcineurin-like phosphoesterase
MDSSGAPDGYFSGAVDEVRVWNYARSSQQIQAAMNTELPAEAGLVARWGMNEGTGTDVADSTANPATGSIVGDNYTWLNRPPDVPLLNGPPANATDVSRPAILDVGVADLDTTSLTVTDYGRLKPAAAAPSDFTIVALPDTQYYASALYGGSPAMFNSQTHWVVDNLSTENIAYVVQLGDCVEHGDNDGNTIEWDNAWTALSALEDPTTTLLTFGIPYGVSVGNHDQSPEGDVTGTTALYNAYFGVGHFSGRTYYGGHYGTNNNNWYDLFSASGMNFIVVSMEYDTIGNSAVLQWANNLLQTYSDRRAIVVSHYITDSSGVISKGLNSSFGQQGRAIYNSLRGNPNLFLMLCGHIIVGGEGQRVDVFNGHTVYTLLSNYQSREGGGNGWLRTLRFSPQRNQISVQTYSPWLNQFENDADSSFTLTYNMQDGANSGFSIIATNTDVPSGTSSTIAWNNLLPNTTYEWYVAVSDGKLTIVSPVWQFTTAAPIPTLSVVSRKTHNTASTFDLTLNSGTPITIEPRSGGSPSGNHMLVFTFLNTLNASNPVGSITATATAGSRMQNVSATGSLGTDTHQYFVNLSGVPNASQLTVTLNSVRDAAGNAGYVSAHMDVLLGDVNQTGGVDGNDVSAVQARTQQTANSGNFLYDVNITGGIDGNDVSMTQGQTRTSLP